MASERVSTKKDNYHLLIWYTSAEWHNKPNQKNKLIFQNMISSLLISPALKSAVIIEKQLASRHTLLHFYSELTRPMFWKYANVAFLSRI